MAGLKHLIDMNVFLEGLLEQEKAEIIRSFFQNIDYSDIISCNILKLEQSPPAL